MEGRQVTVFKGLSGEAYSLTSYECIPVFNFPMSCVYLVSRRRPGLGKASGHTVIYVGHTKDFDAAFRQHPEYPLFLDYGFNCVSILPLNDAMLKASVQLDLISGLSPLYGKSASRSWEAEAPQSVGDGEASGPCVTGED